MHRTQDFTEGLTATDTSNDNENGSGNTPDSPSGTDNLSNDSGATSSGTMTLDLHQSGIDTSFTQTIHQVVIRRKNRTRLD